MQQRIPTGFPQLDQITGGLMPTRTYLLTGNIGSEKLELSLIFLLEGLRRGERCLWISGGRPRDLFIAAQALDVDLSEFLRDDQLVVIAPSASFSDLVVNTGDAKSIVDEIATLAESRTRVVVEAFSSLLQSRYPVTDNPGFYSALLNGFDDMPATVLLSEEATEIPRTPAWRVLERFCFGLFHIEDATGPGSVLRIRKYRGASLPRKAIPFTLLKGGGIGNENGAEADADAIIPDGGRIMVFRSPEGEEIETALGDAYEITSVESPMQAVAKGITDPHDLAIIELADGTSAPFEVCARMRESGIRTPVLFVGGRRMRALDRIRCFRSGGDDIVARPLHGDEFRYRVMNLIRRGPSTNLEVHSGVAEQSFAERFAESMGDAERGEELLEYNTETDEFLFTPRVTDRFSELIALVRETGLASIAYLSRFQNPDGEDPLTNRAPKEAAEVVLRCCRNDDLVIGISGCDVAIVLVGSDEAGFQAFRERLHTNLIDHFKGNPDVTHHWATALIQGRDDTNAILYSLTDAFRNSFSSPPSSVDPKAMVES